MSVELTDSICRAGQIELTNPDGGIMPDNRHAFCSGSNTVWDKIFMCFPFFKVAYLCFVMSKWASISSTGRVKSSVMLNRHFWVSLSHFSLAVEPGGHMPTKFFQ